MHVIHAQNVNQAMGRALEWLFVHGITEDSRNGPVVVAPEPVTTVYNHPRERVLYSPMRDANPFFHFMESLWMMAGRNDVRWPVFFNKNFGQFSDDGEVFHGAYGHRWRHWFGYDQLKELAHELTKDHNTRRAVLSMWDANADVHAAASGGKDVPCNTHAYFDVRGGRLNMTVCCRSNDVIWGAYGANVVHFSVLLEVLAAWVGVPVGVYRQMSNNFHIYETHTPRTKFRNMAWDAAQNDHCLPPYPIVNTPIDSWFKDLDEFMHSAHTGTYKDQFFTAVASPIYAAYEARKEGKGTGTKEILRCEALDWRLACQQWIQRREAAKQEMRENRPQV